MGHKTSPKSLRIRELKDWKSRGFYGKKAARKLQEDFKIRNLVKQRIDSSHLEKIIIERFPSSAKVTIFTSRPGIVIGRRGEKVTALKEILEKGLGIKNLKLEVKPVKKMWSSAKLTAEWMAQQIEKRVSYRRVLGQALNKIMRNKKVEGAQVQVSGRLNGREMSRTEKMKEGKLKRQMLRGDLDYAYTKAKCSYGVIGVKVWIYKGEKL